jgi:hypothetical protein
VFSHQKNYFVTKHVANGNFFFYEKKLLSNKLNSNSFSPVICYHLDTYHTISLQNNTFIEVQTEGMIGGGSAAQLTSLPAYKG